MRVTIRKTPRVHKLNISGTVANSSRTPVTGARLTEFAEKALTDALLRDGFSVEEITVEVSDKGK